MAFLPPQLHAVSPLCPLLCASLCFLALLGEQQSLDHGHGYLFSCPDVPSSIWSPGSHQRGRQDIILFLFMTETAGDGKWSFTSWPGHEQGGAVVLEYCPEDTDLCG